MYRLLFLALFLSAIAFDASSRTVKLGDMAGQQRQQSLGGMRGKSSPVGEISCFEDDDCSEDQECVALRCENVCKNSTCVGETYCLPTGKEKAHTFKCVECVVNFHCKNGMICGKDRTCIKPDPCINAVCSPAAPYCMPVPYKTLPYTCVQCLADEHCPPVAGLSRSCVDGYCLFNVEGNIPKKNR